MEELPFNQECTICQELINYDDEIMRCRNPEHDHIFHDECATSWLLRGHNTCPTCREILTDNPPSIYPTPNQHFSEFVPNYDYLEGRSWYVNDNNLQNLLSPSINAIISSQNPYGFSMCGMVIKKRVCDTQRPMRGMIPWKRPAYPDSFTMCLKVCTNDLAGSPFAALL